MGSLSIQKGKRAERQIASALNIVLERVALDLGVEPARLSRNLSQTQIGGFDLHGLDWAAIEIKHHKQVSLGAWWAQTCRQAGCDLTGAPLVGMSVREPVLLWKQHGGKWNARLAVHCEAGRGCHTRCVVNMDWETFLNWFELRVEVELRKATADAFSSGQEAGLFG